MNKVLDFIGKILLSIVVFPLMVVLGVFMAIVSVFACIVVFPIDAIGSLWVDDSEL